MLLNLSCPAVSQSCKRTRIPLTYIFFEINSAPVVEVVFFGSNLFWVYRYNRLVLPTPEVKAAWLESCKLRTVKREAWRCKYTTYLCCPLLRSWRRPLGHIWPANRDSVLKVRPSTLQRKRMSQGRKGHDGREGVGRRERRPSPDMWPLLRRMEAPAAKAK